MQHIGFQCNYDLSTPKRRRLTPSILNRLELINRRLRVDGFELFAYSPDVVSPEDAQVRGFHFMDGRMQAATAPLPPVNGNWTHRTRRLLDRSMGYRQFGEWSADRGVQSYVPHEFSELLGNKLETYKLVRSFHETLHPHCEVWARSAAQLQYFIDTGRLTFIKPRTGSKGNRIISLTNDATGLRATHYFRGVRRSHRAKNVADILAFLDEMTPKDRKYIIQHGVETLRHENRTFDIRVTMLFDGRQWHWLHEGRLSPQGSTVSNVSQGGRIVVTEDLLFDLMGSEQASEMIYSLQSESFGLVDYLERLHPGDILEVAFDFAIDVDGRLKLLEINTKPGLAGLGSDISVFDMKPEHEAAFERWVYPHTTFLAEFLLSKVGHTIAARRTFSA